MDDEEAGLRAVARFKNVFGQALDRRTPQPLGHFIYGIMRCAGFLDFILSDLEGGIWKASKDVSELEHMKSQMHSGSTLEGFLTTYLWAPLVVRSCNDLDAMVEWHVNLGPRTKLLPLVLARVADAGTAALEQKSLLLSAFDAFYAVGAPQGVGGRGKECPPTLRSADCVFVPTVDPETSTSARLPLVAGVAPVHAALLVAESTPPQHATSSAATATAAAPPASTATTAADARTKPVMRASAPYRAPLKRKKLIVAGDRDDEEDSEAEAG